MATSDVLIVPPSEGAPATSSMIKPEDFLSSKDESKMLEDTDSSDLPPISGPVFVRQKTKEEEQEETDVFLPLAPSFRRQRSFPHTIRPVPVLGDEEQKKIYFHDILFNMGFNEQEIETALKSGGDKGIEELVDFMVSERKTRGTTPGSTVSTPSPFPSSPSKPEEKKEEKTSEETSEETPLSLSLEEEEATEWKCRYCNGYQNSSSTEVCIQCNRARALCEQLSDEQKDEQKKKN